MFRIVQTNTSDITNTKVTRLLNIWMVLQSPASFGRVTCLPPKNASAPWSAPGSRWPLLCDKLAISKTYLHAKNRNDLRPTTLSKVPSPVVGFSAVAILGGGWLQSPASDGPPWNWHRTSLSLIQWWHNSVTHICGTKDRKVRKRTVTISSHPRVCWFALSPS